MKKRNLTLQDYFDSRTAKRGTRDCWLWTGAVGKRACSLYGWSYHSAAYGEFAHRLSYRLHNGPIPADHVVRHTCDNPPCVNPAHLLTGTVQDNVQDMICRNRTAERNGDANPNVKVTSAQREILRREYWILPRTAYGKVKHGFLKPLALKWGITPNHLTLLARY